VGERAVVAGPTLRKKDFVDRVTARSGVKRRDAKLAAEAALSVLGEAIENGESVNLPPFGKLRVNRTKTLANATVHVCRLRQPIARAGGGADAPDTAEEPAEE